jgi:hypothetical protein
MFQPKTATGFGVPVPPEAQLPAGNRAPSQVPPPASNPGPGGVPPAPPPPPAASPPGLARAMESLHPTSPDVPTEVIAKQLAPPT